MRRALLLTVGRLTRAVCLVHSASRGVGAQQIQPTARDLQILFISGAKFSLNNRSLDAMFSSMYLLTGGGRHSVALVTDDGVVLVDTKGPGWGPALREKIRLVSDLPVTMIINTTPIGGGANGDFPDVVDIVAHENTKARLAGMDAFSGQNARFLPNKVFKEQLSLPLETAGARDGTNRVDVYYFGPGPSDGDTVVVFPSWGVAYLGDLFPDKAVPAIETSSGGSPVSLPETLAKALARLRKEGIDILIPGRAQPPSTKGVGRWFSLKDLQEYTDFNQDFLESVRTSFRAGKSVDNAMAALSVLSDKYKQYGMEQAKASIEAIYKELEKR